MRFFLHQLEKCQIMLVQILDLNKYFQFFNSSTMQNYCTLIEDYNTYIQSASKLNDQTLQIFDQ